MVKLMTTKAKYTAITDKNNQIGTGINHRDFMADKVLIYKKYGICEKAVNKSVWNKHFVVSKKKKPRNLSSELD